MYVGLSSYSYWKGRKLYIRNDLSIINNKRDSCNRICGKNVYSCISDYLVNGGLNSFG